MDINDANFVFSKSYRYLGVYDRTATNPANSLVIGHKLNDGAQRYIAISIETDGTIVTSSQSAPTSPSQSFYYCATSPSGTTPLGPPSDVWNSTSEIIVGTGDLRPSEVFHIYRHSLENGGIILSCPKAGELIVYIP